MAVRVFGRECLVPKELPWHYVMKVEAMVRGRGGISGEENMRLFQQMFSEDDCRYILNHPEFRASTVWELIAYTWLRGDGADQAPQPAFKTEDDVKIAASKGGKSAKKAPSAR